MLFLVSQPVTTMSFSPSSSTRTTRYESNKIKSLKNIPRIHVDSVKHTTHSPFAKRRIHSLFVQDSCCEGTVMDSIGTNEQGNNLPRMMDIVKSFVPSEYKPYLFLRNPHVQTILGVFLRRNQSCAYIPRSLQRESDTLGDELQEALELLPRVSQVVITGLVQHFQSKTTVKATFWDERERIDTFDGDFFHVDYKWNSVIHKGQKNRHMVLILHGLESSSNSPLSIDMAQAFTYNGFDVAFINFRGCSGIPNDTLGGYHAGFTDDLLLFLSIIKKRWGDEISLYLSAFSLGSNAVIKCLGDLGTRAVSEFNIRGAAVMGCPFDLNIQYRRLVDDPFNRLVYTRTLLRTLKEKAIYNLYEHCDGDENTNLFDYKKCRDAETIVDIEEGLIVPVFGFQDKFDYYNQSASISVMKNIAVPTLIVNAADDPFFDPTYFPWNQDCNRGGQAPIKLMRTEFGGHLGYIFHVGSRMDEMEIPASSSWICTELARFTKHVRDYKS